MNYADLFRVTLPETALEIAALVVLAVDLGLRGKAALETRVAVAALLGVAGCGLAMLTIPFQAMGPFVYPGTREVLLAAGGSASIAQVGILVLTVLTLFLLFGSGLIGNVGEFTAIVLMSATGGLLICAAQDLLIIFIGLELLSLGLYVLTAFAKKSGKGAEAAIKYYLFGGMSAAFLLFGFSYLYGITGSTSLQQIMRVLYASSSPLVYVALVAIAAGLGFKVAAVPFHLWAPDAYEGAPAPAAAFIASVSKVASFALLISIGAAATHVLGGVYGALYVTFPGSAPEVHPSPVALGFEMPWSLTLTVLAVASMTFGNLAALVQTSVRRLVAYSAIAHAGYMLLGLAFFSQSTLSASAILYYILTYGLTVIGAFGAIAVVERATGSDGMDAFSGLSRRSPVLSGVLLVLLLSLAGIPPLVGFWAKFNLFAAVLDVDGGKVPFTLVALAVAFSAVSLYYYLQVLKRAYVVPPADQSAIKPHPVTLLVLVLIAASVVVLGCFPALLQGWMASFYPGM